MYHLHISRRSKSPGRLAISAFEYIGRLRRYKGRGDKVRLLAQINMPAWVQTREDYWLAIDSEASRTNARLFFFVEVAIPRALDMDGQNLLVHQFCRYLGRASAGPGAMGDVPVVWAIHEGTRADDAKTGRYAAPHAHIAVFTQINDGVDRPRSRWFRRADGKHPERGGARRSVFIGTKRWLRHVRRAWARLANRALRLAGLSEGIDHRSYAERALPVRPTRHLGPRAAAAVRAGRPSAMATRNDRISKLNEATVALMEAAHEGRRRAEAIHRAEEAKLHALQATSDRRRRELLQLLEAHPLAVDDLEASDEARIGLMINLDEAEKDGPASKCEGLRAAIDSALKPDGWFGVHEAERSWWIRHETGDVIVATTSVIATDAADAAAGRRLSELARCLGLTRYKAFAKWDADEARSALGKSAKEAGHVVNWMGPRWHP